MAAIRSFGHYSEDEVLPPGEFVTVMDVREHRWLLEHSHDFPEIVCVLGGKGTQFLNGASVPIQAGDVYLIPLGTTHVFRPAADGKSDAELPVRDVIIRSQWLEEWMKSVPDEEVRDLMAWLLGKGQAEPGSTPAWIKIADTEGILRRQTGDLMKLLGDRPPVYRTRLAAGLLELLSSLSVATRQGRLQQAQWPPAEKARQPVKARIAQAIEEVTLRNATLAGVAAKLHVSSRQLSRIFPAHFGMSFKSCLRELRFRESQRLLLESSATVKEIMERVGCKDADHFYEQFKRRTGLTPGQFRRRHIRT